MLNNEIYQKIYDELSDYLISGWNRVVIYLEFGTDSYSFSFYEKCDNRYIKCYDIPFIKDKDLDTVFKKIYTIVSSERDSLKDKWSNMTMIVEASGDMHTDFDYTDLSAGNYSYMKAWKKRYLI